MKSLGVSTVLTACFYVSTLHGADEKREQLTWDAPRMHELDRELRELFATFTEPSTKSNYGPRANLIDKLIESRLTSIDMRDLIADADQISAEFDRQSGLQRIVITRMVWVFMEQGDRKSLVSLFSKCCPDRYHFIDIEEMLVIHGEKLKDPIKVLAEALTECKRDPTRKELVAVLRRAFEGSGIRGENDDGFVKNAMDWYDREKDKLERNPNYDGHSSVGIPRTPLFWFKNSPEAEEYRRRPRPTPVPPMVD